MAYFDIFLTLTASSNNCITLLRLTWPITAFAKFGVHPQCCICCFNEL